MVRASYSKLAQDHLGAAANLPGDTVIILNEVIWHYITMSDKRGGTARKTRPLQ